MLERPHRKSLANGADARLAPPPEIQFISTGCTALDCALGGGWPVGRIVNIVGDKATGKSLLAIEACANFARKFPRGFIDYRESESAFLASYAKSIGAPVDRISFVDRKGGDKFDTVEDFYADLDAECDKAIKRNRPGLYILDSLDSLSDAAELERAFDKNTMGQDKPKQMSELFRRITRKIESARICVIIISQTRANIGVTFGRKTTRSGGTALNFYASQIVYLAMLDPLKKTINGQEHVVGVRVRAKCDKNKVGDAFKQIDFTIRLKYGIDDLTASLDYLMQTGKLGLVDLTKEGAKKMIANAMSMPLEEYRAERDTINAAMRRVWLETETALLPAHRKYE